MYRNFRNGFAVSRVTDFFNLTCTLSMDSSGNITCTDPEVNHTTEELTRKYNEFLLEYTMNKLRAERNKLLNESDWVQSRDVILSSDEEWKIYRQTLRDLPSNSPDIDIDENDELINVKYPEKPSV